MKTCTQCGISKPLREFARVSSARGGGPTADCKLCKTARTVAWQKANPEKRSVISARYYANNPERFAAVLPVARERQRAKREKYPVETAAALASWKKANRAKCNASLAAYKFKKYKATPAWANEFFIEEAYDLAQQRTRVTGMEWEVDHIVPLRSKLVSGLHVEYNLQVIPAVMNKQKGNRVWPAMPVA